MSNLSMQCCCETELGDCTDSCDCATSYSVTALSDSYRYESTLDYGGAWNCTVCPSTNGCSATWWGIDLTWTLVGPMVLTRAPDPSGTGCVYTGTGTVLVTGSLDYTYRWMCNDLEGCPSFEDTQSYNFSTETTVCVTVRCEASPTGFNAGCNGTVAGAAWRHTVEICDFIVTCSADVWTDSGCDPVCPTQSTPVALRCQGGAIDYLTPLVCLNTLVPADWLCAGYRNGSGASYCWDTVGASAPRGPFGVQEEGECSPGQDDFPCLDAGQVSTGTPLWHTNHFAPPVQPLCGAWSILQNICNGTVRLDVEQLGCQTGGIAPIAYA